MGRSEVFHFGRFTLDVTERRLLRGTAAVPLSPKTYEVLVALVREPGRLMRKHELLARVWPEVFVEEGILTVHVAALRKAFGDQRGAPDYIETVSGRGYRFVAAVTRESEEEPDLPAPARPTELYECIGRGQVHLLSGSYADLPHAAEAFRAAIALDPTYAPAHAGLARALCTQATLRLVAHREAFTEAKTAALRALAMDSGSAEAQVALGTVLFLAEWDWIGAERSLERALAINPDHIEALLQYASLHEAMGRLDDGLRLKQQAFARKPRSPLVLVHMALSHWYQRRYEEALEWAHRALDVDPGHFLAAVFVGGVYWRIGDIDRFLAQIMRLATAGGASDEIVAGARDTNARMKQVYTTDGFEGWSQFMAEQIEFMADVAFRRAVLYGAAGRLDEAFACLDQAIAERDPSAVYLAVAPELDYLRSDPRFADRLRAMSLPVVN